MLSLWPGPAQSGGRDQAPGTETLLGPVRWPQERRPPLPVDPARVPASQRVGESGFRKV